MAIALPHHVSKFLIFAIGMITLPHAWLVPIPVFGFFCVLLVWRYIGISSPKWLPSKWLLTLLTIAGFTLLFLQFQTIFGRDAGTSLFVIALGLKLMEIRSNRDLYLIIYLAFVVVAAQFLYSQSIAMAAYIFLAICSLLATLVVINSQQPQHLRALKNASVIVLQATPLALVIFVLFPRLEPPRWSFLDENNAITGLSDTLEPGTISNLGLSNELVFRVRFTGDIPSPEQRYWRGPVYTYTDGKKWTQIEGINTHRHQAQKTEFSGLAYQYTLLMEPQNKAWVFALEMAADYPRQLTKNADHQLITTKDPHYRAEYQIVSYADYKTGAISNLELQQATQLPAAPSSRIKQLVGELNASNSQPEHYIANIYQYFKKNQFYYTLKPPLMLDTPIESFLFDTRRGFCSHYATAFVYLLRVAGIPARVVGGFQGGTLNEVGNFLEIRQANAHAWAEVWLQGRGWVRFDPTAVIAPERITQDVNIDLQIANGEVNFSPVNLSSASLKNLLKHSRYLWNSLDYNWQRWVINYDFNNQMDFLAIFGINSLYDMVYWLSIIVILMTLLLAVLLLHKHQKALDPAALHYKKYCQKLAKHGLQIKTGEGAKHFSKRCKQRFPAAAESIEQITQLYIAIRYQNTTSTQHLQRFKMLVAQLKL